MDSRLKLTAKQKALVKRLKDTFNEMRAENIGILYTFGDHDDTNFYFINESEVIKYGWDPQDEEGYESYESLDESDEENLVEYTLPSKLPSFFPGCVYNYSSWGNDNWFSVILPANEEAISFMKKKEKNNKLALLNSKMDTLKGKLKKYQDANDGTENTIAKLKERNAAQEIIDEEIESIKSNKKQISKLKEEIKVLRDEIKSVK